MAGRKRRGPGRPVSPGAHYRRIAEDLRARLRAGEWRAGQPLPSLRALARRFQAGEYTVRMAVELLKREGRVRTSARRRLVAAAAENPPGALDGLVLQVSSHSLEALHRGPYTDELVRGVQIGAGQMGAPFLALSDRHFRHNLPTDALELPVRGIVLVGVFTDRTLKQYEKLGVPAVLADQPPGGRRLHAVAADNVAAARAATARLIALGHRRLAFVRFVQTGMRRVDPDALERQEGFFAAVREAGLPESAVRVYNSLDGDTPQSPGIRALVRETPPFTAVLSASGWRAALVAIAAEAEGRSVPGDLSVACFQAAEADYPRFSGPRIDFEDMGRLAAHLLDEPKHPPRHVRVPAPWVEAGSVAPPGNAPT